MHINRLLQSKGIWVIVLFFIATSCYENPDFSNIPAIKVRDVRYVREANEIIEVTLYFEDGDGNIGVSNEGGSPDFIFADIDGDNVIDTISANARFDIFKRSDDSGEYERIDRQTLQNNFINPIEFSIPVVGNINLNSPVSGTITQDLIIGPANLNLAFNFFRDDSLYIEGILIDRDGQVSNVARSESFTLLQFYPQGF